MTRPSKEAGTYVLLNELKLLVQSDKKLAGTDLDEETRTRLEARHAAAQDKLEANGHDVDVLLEQRWDVAKKRQTARMAQNPIFDGVEVSISGYTIPAPRAADGSGFGYLVPQVGMCSHLPPPPPNQLVRVRLRADQQVGSLYTPVPVSGLLRVEPGDETIFILDGEARMLSGWALEAGAKAANDGAIIYRMRGNVVDPAEDLTLLANAIGGRGNAKRPCRDAGAGAKLLMAHH